NCGGNCGDCGGRGGRGSRGHTTSVKGSSTSYFSRSGSSSSSSSSSRHKGSSSSSCSGSGGSGSSGSGSHHKHKHEIIRHPRFKCNVLYTFKANLLPGGCMCIGPQSVCPVIPPSFSTIP